MQFIEYRDAGVMMTALAGQIADELRVALSEGESAALAVPGGTTPGPIFDVLSQADLDWARVFVLLTDERWVPESSERSNTRLLRQRLLTGPAAKAQLVPLYAPAERPEEVLPVLAAGLAPHLPLDVVLLGMGADMHTASIFPGADLLDAALNGDELLLPMRAPGAPEPRITLSAAVLRAAKTRHIVITGAAKRAAFERAQSLPSSEAPVAAVLPGATIHWAES
ncbi:MAG: 6-phosphogluconolactonase [Rhodobacteraceae bacterium]|nr:6-phosphogluconolactonase [Paracoccaceae bacterium]